MEFKISKKYVRDLIVKVFNVLNGWVNPINPAKYLYLKDGTEKSFKSKYNLLGRADLVSISMFPDEFLHPSIIEYLKIITEEINGNSKVLYDTYVVCTVLHELSHMDQNPLGYMTEDGIDVWAFEDANELHASEFFIENIDKISKRLGFDLDNTLWVNVNDVYTREPNVVYHSFKSKQDQYDYLICMASGYDVKFLNDKNIEVGTTGISYVIDGYKYNAVAESTLEMLEERVTTSYKSFISKVFTTADGIIISLKENGASPYPYNFEYC